MPIQKELIREGMRLRHPSGVVTTTAIGELQKLREFTLRSISFFQKQIKMINTNIERLEALRKT